MSRFSKISIGVLALALLAVVYLILSSQPVKIKKTENNEINKTSQESEKNMVNMDLLEKDYKNQAQKIVKNFLVVADNIEALINKEKTATGSNDILDKQNGGTSTVDKNISKAKNQTNIDKQTAEISKLKIELLGLMVPPKFKDLHIKLLGMLGAMNTYLLNPGTGNVNDSLNILNQLIAKYPWLSHS